MILLLVPPFQVILTLILKEALEPQTLRRIVDEWRTTKMVSAEFKASQTARALAQNGQAYSLVSGIGSTATCHMRPSRQIRFQLPTTQSSVSLEALIVFEF